MSSVCNKFAKCDDVIVNFCVRSQTIVKLKEFKEYVEEDESVVLTDEQAKTLFHQWLGEVYGHVDGQQAIVDIELDNDNDMDNCMDNLWETVHDNVEIPKDWEVAKCQTHTTGCNKISVGTYGDDKTPLCEEHKELANYDDDGNLKPDSGEDEEKEVAIVSDKPEVIDFFAGKTVRDTEMEALKAEMATLKAENSQLKERIKQVVKHFEKILSAVLN